jgi:hypothetical protein
MIYCNLRLKYAFLLLGAILSLTACAPKIYVIDRHTIMEQEAAGEWPALEDEFTKKGTQKGATFFKEDLDNPAKKRALNVLNGEISSF